jgi:hypothetical protein
LKRILIPIVAVVSLIAFFSFVWRMDGMSLGGDDSRLYYLFPSEWAEHVGRYSWYSTFAGHAPRYFFLPFTWLISRVASLGLNPQPFLWAVNLVGGFGFSYLVISKLAGGKGTTIGPLLGALTYAFAPIVVFTQWVNLLYSIYWIMLLPALIFFLLQAVERRNPWWLLPGIVLVVLFAPAVAAAPWSVPIVLAFLIFVPPAASSFHGARHALTYIAIYGFLLVAASLFWLFPHLGGLGGNFTVQAALSEGSTEGAIELVEVVSSSTNLFDTLGASISRGMMDGFNWPQRDFASISYALVPFNIGLLIIAVVALFQMPRGSQRRILSAAAFTTFTLMLFVSNSLGVVVHTIALFPPLGMIRNFFDKFAIPFALVYGIFVGLGLERFAQSVKRKWPRTLVVGAGLAALLLVLQGSVLIDGSLLRELPHIRGESDTRVVNIPEDVKQIGDRLAAPMGGGAILHVPLLSVTSEWTTFRSSASPGVYLGLSPMKVLGNRNPFVGELSFANPNGFPLYKTLRAVLDAQEPVTLAAFLAWLGIDFVLVERDTPAWVLERFADGPTSAEWEYLLHRAGAGIVTATADRALYRIPQGQILPAIFGVDSMSQVPDWETFHGRIEENLPAFGERVVLHSDAVRPAVSTQLDAPDVTFLQVSPVEYHVRVLTSGAPFFLVLNQGFDQGWALFEHDTQLRCYGYVTYSATTTRECRGGADSVSEGSLAQPIGEHVLANAWENAWLVDPEPGEQEFVVYFEPQRLFSRGVWASGGGLVLGLLIVAGLARRRRNGSDPEGARFRSRRESERAPA